MMQARASRARARTFDREIAYGASPHQLEEDERQERSARSEDHGRHRVHGFVKANAGKRLEEIGKSLGAATKDLTLPVAKLLAARRLRKTGQKRGTRYFVATGAATKARAARKPRRRARSCKA